MGLAIHYSGYILEKGKIISLKDEVADICKSLNWQTYTFDDDEIKGIAFAPERSEPVFLTFNPAGRMLSPVSILTKDIYDDIQVPKELYYTTSTKTEYAGIEAHIAIIKLLKYISQKYLRDFTLDDEGYYWETNDEQLLRERFDKYRKIGDAVYEALTDIPNAGSETGESLVERIEKILKEKLGGNGS